MFQGVSIYIQIPNIYLGLGFSLCVSVVRALHQMILRHGTKAEIESHLKMKQRKA